MEFKIKLNSMRMNLKIAKCLANIFFKISMNVNVGSQIVAQTQME